MREDINIEDLKKQLVTEKEHLEEQLKSLGKENPENPADWDANAADIERDMDRNVQADKHEEYGERSATLSELEVRHANVAKALERIEQGTYGFDEETGDPIAKERLEANPAATKNI